MTGDLESGGPWSRELYFLLACIGAAVGLGNLWRFPYVAYSNGGGAFLLPYVICLFAIGIPVALLEIGLGRWSGGSIVGAFSTISSRLTWIGWWALVNSLVIVFYYSVVINWCVQYAVYSLHEAWQPDAAAFFTGTVLSLTDSPFIFGSLSLRGAAALALVWGTIYFIVKGGTKVLSRVLLVTVPLPLVLLVTLSVRSLTLPGGSDGLWYFLTPDTDALLHPAVWAAAASQVVLSLGLGMGQMVAYASRKKDNKHIVKSGIMIFSADLLFSLLSGVTVFATMGILAASRGVDIGNLKLDGLFLAFVSYPTALSFLPLAPLWGLLFFLLLIALGIDSVFAVVEANLAGFEDMRLRIGRRRMAAILCLVGFVGGLFFISGSGLFWLDIVDHWVAYYSIASIVILECLVFGTFGPIGEITRLLTNKLVGLSSVAWRFCTVVLAPVVLIIVFGHNLIKETTVAYGGYPWSALLLGGWGVAIGTVAIGFAVAVIHNRRTRSGHTRSD